MEDKGLIKSYQITIRDFEIELRHTEWYSFKRRRKLRKKINYFEEKLTALYEN